MIYTSENIKDLERIFRLNLINSVSGIKPANLIGTKSKDGITNLAIFSSVMHLGSNPPLIGFILRPFQEVPRNTFQNILDSNYYTINHVHINTIEGAHKTSAKFDDDVSEFKECGFEEEFLNGFQAPFVKGSQIRMGIEFKQRIPIEMNDTSLIIGEIKILDVNDDVIADNGYLDLEKAETAGISGLNSYYSLKKENEFPYARV
mgnify:FL=1